jgi:hypothetical protein
MREPPEPCGQRPVEDSLHLLVIHGDTYSRDHMAEVGDIGPTKLTLQALDEEVVLLQFSEYQAHVQHVLSPAAAVIKISLKKISTNRRRKGRMTAFIKD